ncbi:MAG TPA: hypothetical protein VIT67_11880, partial [Povalibacter sp.]
MDNFFAVVGRALVGCCLAGSFSASFAAEEAEHGLPRASDSSGSAIVEWNQLAYDIAVAEDQFTTFKGQRALAMMHLAQHDALNSVKS